ncbi:MAG: metalloregulator ArsR/SmtB family transcription factor [Methylovulum sp.]|nr:metalloregulator ArsR/SmtB family transcription factor [Methylovulum sp.]
MELTNLYKCLCDVLRLRILNLLKEGPLCVCHLQEILGETQVKTSKQLQYMKKLGVVGARREGVWMVYSLPEPTHPVLLANLHCLQADTDGFGDLIGDLKKRSVILRRFAANPGECPPAVYQATDGCQG